MTKREGKTPNWTSGSLSHDMFKIVYNLAKNFIVHEWLKKPMIACKEIIDSLYKFVTKRFISVDGDFLTNHPLLGTRHWSLFLKDQGDQLKRYHSDIKNYQFSFMYQIYRQGGDQLLTGGRLMSWSILHSEKPFLGNPHIGSFSSVRVLKHKLLY